MKEEIDWFKPEDKLPEVDHYRTSNFILIQTDTHVFEGKLERRGGETYFTDCRSSEEYSDLRYTLFEGKFRPFEYENGERVCDKGHIVAWAEMPKGIK